MRTPLALIAVLATLLGAAAAPGQAPLAAPLPAPVYWAQDVFMIPYQWSGRSDVSTAEEVILYLSKDRGASWSEVTRAKPDLQSFNYRAERDGEYWFAVRTLDESGRLWPAGGYSPELRVIVDTQIPVISPVAGQLDSEGRLRVVCGAIDANLDPTSLQLVARVEGSDEWTELPLTTQPPAGNVAPGELRATATWQAPPGASGVTLRFAVKDRAGNPAGGGGMVIAATSPPPVPQASEPIASRPIASQPIASGQTTPATGPLFAGPPTGDPFLAAPPLELPTRRPPAPPATPWRSASQTTPPRPAPPAANVWQADKTTTAPFRAGNPYVWSSAPATAPNGRRDASPPPSPYHSVSSSRTPAATPIAPATRDPHKHVHADGAVLFVNNPQFALDYDLQSTGDWGVSRVEVWGTTDGGGAWRKFAEDSDHRSPVNVATPGPGRYGFRILVEGVGGLPIERPRPGDPPEIEVVVDPQQPTARLTSVTQGTGYFGDHLIVHWRAGDEHLASRPVALLYSDRPGGPWVSIASNLEPGDPERGGRYAWRLQRHLPRALYVRLEVRDRAGNVAVDRTPAPITLRFAEPTGRIRGARPLPGG